jgi:hypothetical protein
MEKERCNCGQTQAEYHPDENQWEPVCWDCYYQVEEGAQLYVKASVNLSINPSCEEDKLPF